MLKKKWAWLTGIMIFIVVLSVFTYKWKQLHTTQTISKNEASEIILNKYSGRISQIKLDDNNYIIKFEKDSNLYEIKVNANTAEISSLTQIKQNQTNKQINNVVINEEKIKKIATAATPGKIETLTHSLINNQIIFTVVLEDRDQQNFVKVDGQTGKVLSITTKNHKEPTKNLTEQDAIKIAMNQVSGEVDEVKVKRINHMTYYFVQIDTEDEKEATLQIQAITGEVKSVTWDD